ncbi:uncharacterized protein LOC126839300 [Adelges cooleyi]|uniref:uncharacterized protein LOC126839300 n=1 Tax=Adelges cooleyi TaxID=133065 RepID=UPI00218020BF|nr:uncharacterized protein LOC126839300 [Adelges cooleyi]
MSLLLLFFASRRPTPLRCAVPLALLVGCLSLLLADCRVVEAAIPLDDEKSKEYIIGHLAGIIEDQRNKMRSVPDREIYQQRFAGREIPSIREDDEGSEFTYDQNVLVEPEVNTGDQDVPFAVLPYNPRYYRPEYYNRLAVPPSNNDVYYGKNSKFHKIKTTKSREVQHVTMDSDGYKSKFTTENTTTTDVSLELPHPALGHKPFATSIYSKFSQDDYYFFAKAAGVGLAVLVVLVISSIACFRMQRNKKAAADIDYPAYGITGPNKDFSPTGDRRLAQSAQMYHYQHQKQQIIAMETNSAAKEGRSGSITDPDSDDDNEEGDYTVYECPGLAPAGEMEVKNPLFHDDNTPASSTNASKEDIRENGSIPVVPTVP